jgi:hypothetical protein
MIDRDIFVVLVILREPKKGVVYFPGSDREVIAQSVDVSNWLSNPNDTHDVKQIRGGSGRMLRSFVVSCGRRITCPFKLKCNVEFRF